MQCVRLPLCLSPAAPPPRAPASTASTASTRSYPYRFPITDRFLPSLPLSLSRFLTPASPSEFGSELRIIPRAGIIRMMRKVRWIPMIASRGACKNVKLTARAHRRGLSSLLLLLTCEEKPNRRPNARLDDRSCVAGRFPRNPERRWLREDSREQGERGRRGWKKRISRTYRGKTRTVETGWILRIKPGRMKSFLLVLRYRWCLRMNDTRS